MKALINNYINGNLRIARKQAKRFYYRQIRDALIKTLDYSLNKAALTADWLKTGYNFQEACDAQ